MSIETINFTCEKHCYEAVCAKPHTARLPENRGVVCTLKSEFLPLKNSPCASSLQQQDPQQHPASSLSPRTRTKGKNQLSSSSPTPQLQALNLLVSASMSSGNTLQNLEFAGPRLRVLFEITKAFQEQAGWYSFANRQVVKSFFIICSNPAQIQPRPCTLLQVQAQPRDQNSFSNLSNSMVCVEISVSVSWVTFLQWRRHHPPCLCTCEMLPGVVSSHTEHRVNAALLQSSIPLYFCSATSRLVDLKHL